MPIGEGLINGKSWSLYEGDCLDVLRELAAKGQRYSAALTDPPYHLQSVVKRFGKDGSVPAQFGTDGAFARQSRGFMGKIWDGGDIAFSAETWKLVYDCLLPGAYLFAFGGTRGVHRMACAIEDAGFEIRDRIRFECSAETKYGEFFEGLSPEQRETLSELLHEQGELSGELAWVYGSGMPKSHNVSKALDKKAGKERESEQWEGFGTALKPCYEPIIIARKPVEGTVADNVSKYGVGGLNIDACRIDYVSQKDIDQARVPNPSFNSPTGKIYNMKAGEGRNGDMFDPSKGRWPGNLCHDGSDEILAGFPSAPGQLGLAKSDGSLQGNKIYGPLRRNTQNPKPRQEDNKSAARFFYSAKATKKDRAGSSHATVKPLTLLRYLCRLCCPPGGTILDPFAGSGTTGQAAVEEGFNAVLIEREDKYVGDILLRMAALEVS